MYQSIFGFLIYWAIFGLIIGLCAKCKNRNGFLWGIIGGPFLIIGLLVLIFKPFLCPKCRKKLNKKQRRDKICPDCGSDLQAWKIVCGNVISIIALSISFIVIGLIISLLIIIKNTERNVTNTQQQTKNTLIAIVSMEASSLSFYLDHNPEAKDLPTLKKLLKFLEGDLAKLSYEDAEKLYNAVNKRMEKLREESNYRVARAWDNGDITYDDHCDSINIDLLQSAQNWRNYQKPDSVWIEKRVGFNTWAKVDESKELKKLVSK